MCSTRPGASFSFVMRAELFACHFCKKNDFGESDRRESPKTPESVPSQSEQENLALRRVRSRLSAPLRSRETPEEQSARRPDARSRTRSRLRTRERNSIGRVDAVFSSVFSPESDGCTSRLFSILLVDPPFRYVKEKGRGVAENHYRTTSDEYLASLPVGSLATRDALLFVWCSGATLDHAIALCSAWGFAYKTVAFVWIKTNRSGAPQSIALGSYTRPGSEFVLLATRGRGSRFVSERVDQVFHARRLAHSAKPPRVAEAIDRLVRGGDVKKIELFARGKPRDGWSAWGDEAE